MKKSELKNGMVVEFRSGRKFLYLTQTVRNETPAFCGFGGTWMCLTKYDDDLMHNHGGYTNGTCDVVAVYEGPFAAGLFNKETGELIWERPKEKTHEIDGKEFSESTIKAALKAYVN